MRNARDPVRSVTEAVAVHLWRHITAIVVPVGVDEHGDCVQDCTQIAHAYPQADKIHQF